METLLIICAFLSGIAVYQFVKQIILEWWNNAPKG